MNNRASAAQGWIALALSIFAQSGAAGFAKQAALSGSSGFDSLFSIWYLAMITALALQAVAWMRALRQFNLSYAYPFMALVLPLNLVVGAVFFGEHISAQNMLGIGLIAAGIAVASSTPPSEGRRA